jgi:hypothetical protein
LICTKPWMKNASTFFRICGKMVLYPGIFHVIL